MFYGIVDSKEHLNLLEYTAHCPKLYIAMQLVLSILSLLGTVRKGGKTNVLNKLNKCIRYKATNSSRELF